MTPCLVCNEPVPPLPYGGRAVLCGDTCRAARKRERERRYYEQDRAKYHAAAAAARSQALQTRDGLERVRRQRRKAQRRHRWNDTVTLGLLVAAEVVRRVIGDDTRRGRA
jgi:hypothetical protein